MERFARFNKAMKLKGFNQSSLGKKLGISQSNVSKMMYGTEGSPDGFDGMKHMDQLELLLGVSRAFLLYGDNAPEWAVEPKVDTGGWPEAHMELVGSVSAGDGDLGDYREEVRPFPLNPSWSVVQVRGMSAYPVCYPDQFVIIDLSRGVRPEFMNSEYAEDLHDNICLIQVQSANSTTGEVEKMAYLKRFCRADRAPGGYVMASIDSGRSSPYISPDEILMILPVVGVIFEDPTKPRKKGSHRARINVEPIPA